MAQAVRRLWLLADQFSSRDDPRAACHCLLTALGLVNAPSIECQLRVKLAQLLITHGLEPLAVSHLHKALSLTARWKCDKNLISLIRVMLCQAAAPHERTIMIEEAVKEIKDERWLTHLYWTLLQMGYRLSELPKGLDMPLLQAVDALLQGQATNTRGDGEVGWLLQVAQAYAKLDYEQLYPLIQNAPTSPLCDAVCYLARLRTVNSIPPPPPSFPLIEAQVAQVQNPPSSITWPVVTELSPYAVCMKSIKDAIEAQRQSMGVHHVKAHLLAALKVLNGGIYTNNLAKSCVLLMLGQLYTDTDFHLARTMLEGTLKYAQGIVNHRMERTASKLLTSLPK